MKTGYFVLVIIHGFLHLLGFVKGFGLKEINALTALPMDETFGLLWLFASVLLLVHAIFYRLNLKYSWLFGFMGLITSQVLIIYFWQDAKFGTIPNLYILLVSVVYFGHFKFQQLIHSEITDLLNQPIISKQAIIREQDLKQLPKPVGNWLAQSGILGKPFLSVGKITQKATMKLKPDQENWMKAEAIQYSRLDHPAFIWSVDVEMNPLLNFSGRDKFMDGKGEMLIKQNSLIKVVHETGKKLDEGTMQRYLGEMVWFPSLALSPFISWQAVNDSTAIATFTYKGKTVTGTFYFNKNGDFTKFTALRYMGNEATAKKHEWVLLVDKYQTFEGIRIPSKMNATWKLDKGDWQWLNLEITGASYNENALYGKTGLP